MRAHRKGFSDRLYVDVDPRLLRPTEIAASRGDYARAKMELGWAPRMSFQELIELMVDEDLKRVGA